MSKLFAVPVHVRPGLPCPYCDSRATEAFAWNTLDGPAGTAQVSWECLECPSFWAIDWPVGQRHLLEPWWCHG